MYILGRCQCVRQRFLLVIFEIVVARDMIVVTRAAVDLVWSAIVWKSTGHYYIEIKEDFLFLHLITDRPIDLSCFVPLAVQNICGESASWERTCL